MTMTTLHLALYRGTRAENPGALFFDRLICWRTGSRWSHAELVFDHQPVGPSVCASSSIRDGGVRTKLINLHSGRWDVVPLPGFDDASARRAQLWFVINKGRPYDWLGILGYALPVPLQWSRAWYCSEAVAAALGIGRRRWMSPQKLAEALEVRP